MPDNLTAKRVAGGPGRSMQPSRLIPRRAGGDLRAPLSFAQQRLWFLSRLGRGASEAYHLVHGFRLRGSLDQAALKRALDRLVARHEILRTSFGEFEGEAYQRIGPENSCFNLEFEDLRRAADVARPIGDQDGATEINRLLTWEAARPFDLERGPLVRGRLARLAADDHVLVIALHHIISDGWSVGVLTREFSLLYRAYAAGLEDPLARLPIQYADYAVWQRGYLSGEGLRTDVDYWCASLAGAPALLELPTDRKRPAHQDYRGDFVYLELDETLTQALKELSRAQRMTLFMTVLSGWILVLSRLSAQEDVVVGVSSANRTRSQIEGLIGFFVNMLAVRVDLSRSPTAQELLQRVKAVAIGAQVHQELPFELMVENVQPVRSLTHTPLFQAGFAWRSAAAPSLELPELSVERVWAPTRTSKFDLNLSLGEVQGRIVGGIEYATSLFDRETVERWSGYFQNALREMTRDAARPAAELAILGEAERQQLLYGWNDTQADFAGGGCIHQLFEAQVLRTPAAVAIVFEDAQVSYAQLNARANQLAHALRQRGVCPDARVAICLERGMEMVVALLAVLKAGGAYVPLDPGYPPERLRFMLADSEPVLLLTHRRYQQRLAVPAASELPSVAGLPPIDGPVAGSRAAPGDICVLLLDTEVSIAHGQPATNLEADTIGLRPEHLAYVIYTSGSTGQPKGVAIEHRNTVNLLRWGRCAFTSDVLSQTLFATSLNFDLAVYECLLPLTVGASMRLVPNVLDLAQRPAPVTLINTVPSAMHALLQARAVPSTVSTVNLAGESLTGALVERIFAETEAVTVCNLYGPSETTTYSTWTAIHRGQPIAPHIGRPIANTQVYILDARGEPVPIGVTGELYIGGAGVARGYLNRPQLTAQKFLRDPFVKDPDARMYRSGDLGRWRSDGTLEFLGRNDFQVKVRGFRIELGEIEARLLQHPAVSAAAAVARGDSSGERQLVAYYTGADGHEPIAVEQLRTHLSAVLPEYMVPTIYVRLEALPLTANGKLDRRALPAPEATVHLASNYQPPQGEIETALAQIWAELLHLDHVGRHDNFFSLGGHSLLIMRLVDSLRRRGMTITATDPFVRPTLAELAAHLAATEPLVPDKAVCFRQHRSEPPLFFVHDGTDSLQYVYALSELLADDIPVYGLPPAPPDDAHLLTIEDMASRLVRMIREVRAEGAYRVAGWSTGGVLAYEIANQLLRAGQGVEFLGLFDAAYMDGLNASARVAPEQAMSSFDDKSVLLRTIQAQPNFRSNGGRLPQSLARMRARAKDVDFAELVRMCEASSMLPQDLSGVPAPQVRQMLVRRHTYMRAQIRYRAAAIPIPLYLFEANDSLFGTPLLGWQTVLSQGQIRPCTIPGDHYSIMLQPNIAVLAGELSKGLRAAAG